MATDCQTYCGNGTVGAKPASSRWALLCIRPQSAARLRISQDPEYARNDQDSGTGSTGHPRTSRS